MMILFKFKEQFRTLNEIKEVLYHFNYFLLTKENELMKE